jgi:hypothetical protein
MFQPRTDKGGGRGRRTPWTLGELAPVTCDEAAREVVGVEEGGIVAKCGERFRLNLIEEQLGDIVVDARAAV